MMNPKYIENLKEFFFNKRNIIIASIIFLMLRLIVSFFVVQEFHHIEDYSIAQNLVNGNGYSLSPGIEPTAIKVPVYPLFLAFFIWLFGSTALTAIVFCQHLIFSFVPLLLFKLGEEAGRRKYGFIAAWLFLFHPSYFYYSNVIEVTNLFIPLLLLFFIFTIRIHKQNRYFNIIFTGIISGILILTQPIVLPVIIAIILFFIVKKKIKPALIISIIIVAVMSPWIARNYIEFDRFIPTKTPFWMNFALGWMPAYHGSEKFNIVNHEDELLMDTLLNYKKITKDDEVIYKALFLKYTIQNPWLYIEKTFYQMGLYWYITPKYFDNNSIRFLIVRKIPVILLNILFVFGIIKLFKYDRKAGLIILSILFYFTLLYGLTQAANTRFKLDIEWLEFYAIAILFLEQKKQKIQKK